MYIGMCFSDSDNNLKIKFPYQFYYCLKNNLNLFTIIGYDNYNLKKKLYNLKLLNIVFTHDNMYIYKPYYINPELIYLYKNNIKNNINIDNIEYYINKCGKVVISINELYDMINYLKETFNILEIKLINFTNDPYQLNRLIDNKIYFNEFTINDYNELFTKEELLIGGYNMYNYTYDGIKVYKDIEIKTIYQSTNNSNVNYIIYYKNDKYIITNDTKYKLYKDEYISIYKLEKTIEKYLLKNNYSKNILIFTHVIDKIDGLALEYQETIDYLSLYYSDYTINVITFDNESIDVPILKNTSTKNTPYYKYSIDIEFINISNKLYTRYFHEKFINIFYKLKPSLLFIAYQTTLIHNHVINICKYYNTQIIMRWSGSKLNNEEEEKLFRNGILNSNLVIKIGNIIPLEYEFKYKIIKYFSINFPNNKVNLKYNYLKNNYYQSDNIIKNPKYIIIVVGRICQQKNQINILKAFNLSKLYEISHLLFVGEVTDNETFEQIKKESKKNLICLSLSINDMIKLYNTSDLSIVAPINGEGMSRSLLESFYYCIPAVVDESNNFNYLEYCDKNYCSYCNSNEIESIKNSLNSINIEDSKLYLEKIYHNFKILYSFQNYYKIFNSLFLLNDKIKILYSDFKKFLINDNTIYFNLNKNFFYSLNKDLNNQFKESRIISSSLKIDDKLFSVINNLLYYNFDINNDLYNYLFCFDKKTKLYNNIVIKQFITKDSYIKQNNNYYSNDNIIDGNKINEFKNLNLKIDNLKIINEYILFENTNFQNFEDEENILTKYEIEIYIENKNKIEYDKKIIILNNNIFNTLLILYKYLFSKKISLLNFNNKLITSKILYNILSNINLYINDTIIN